MANMTSLVQIVREFSKQADVYHPTRSPHTILGSAMSELGETAIEINIEAGQSYKTPGPDGVVGEALDTILCLLDLIYRQNPNLKEEELVSLAVAKGSKWIEKISKDMP